jgi:hypothetical protein
MFVKEYAFEDGVQFLVVPEVYQGSCRLWHRVVMWQSTNFSEEHAASIFRVKMESHHITIFELQPDIAILNCIVAYFCDIM